MASRESFVNIMTNQPKNVLYAGVTNHLTRRVFHHKTGSGGYFTSKYRVTRVVYYETFASLDAAVKREKQLKAGSRARNQELINHQKPGRVDLSGEL